MRGISCLNFWNNTLCYIFFQTLLIFYSSSFIREKCFLGKAMMRWESELWGVAELLTLLEITTRDMVWANCMNILFWLCSSCSAQAKPCPLMHYAEMSVPPGKRWGSAEKIIPIPLLLQQGPLPDKCTFLVQGFLFFLRHFGRKWVISQQCQIVSLPVRH